VALGFRLLKGDWHFRVHHSPKELLSNRVVAYWGRVALGSCLLKGGWSFREHHSPEELLSNRVVAD